MAAARVLNVKAAGVPALLAAGDAVYVGRPSRGRKGSPFANPFVIGRDGTRAEVLVRYCDHLLASQELLAELGSLRGRDLVCWCAPEDCHGHILAAAAAAHDPRLAIVAMRKTLVDHGTLRSLFERVTALPRGGCSQGGQHAV